ncbi:MAG: aldolase catalytic domain-containing protein [Deltaproteobacteria bacterium]|nr:aldolase catalytic domain-containing protein [Deltaproteobacteria bacterium]
MRYPPPLSCCPEATPTRRIQVVDCTIRDGGIVNQWHFDEALVRRTFEALAASGVEVMEIGYRAAPGTHPEGAVGPWRYCREEDLRRVARATGMKLAVMLDMGGGDMRLFEPAERSLIDVVRVATYAKDVDGAIDLLHQALDLGYEASANVMAVSACTTDEIDRFLDKLAASRVGTVVVVDSFGSLLPQHVRQLVRRYRARLRPDQRVGVHLHNNQQAAFAGTLAAIEEGADSVDATVHGMGRGAGNAPLELLLMALGDPRYDLTPLLSLVEDYAALRDALRWGYHLPYVVSGWLNRHPRTAIQWMKRPDRYQVLSLIETLREDLP